MSIEDHNLVLEKRDGKEKEVRSRLPVAQGGMGVGISLSGLASAVANEGGIGVIATPAIGKDKPGFFSKHQNAANKEALIEEIGKARAKTKGVLGVNIMVAQSNYEDMILTSIAEGIDIIFSGGGIPLELPVIAGNTETKLVAILSKGAGTVCKRWKRDADCLPDAVVIEGPMAGGHIGFRPKPDFPDPKGNPKYNLDKLVRDAVDEVAPFEQKYGVKIPIIAAGGIYTGSDIYRVMQPEIGADGVQLGTRFVTTLECDADRNFGQTYIDAEESDIVVIKSPVGLPGRAIQNDFLDLASKGKKKPSRCPYKCIRTCTWRESPYCIFEALISASRGDMENGFAFAGANAWRATKFISVADLMAELVREYEEAEAKALSSK